MNVLVVEDEARAAEFIQRGLRFAGWNVSLAPDGQSAAALLQEESFDVIILGSTLSGMSAADFCRGIRSRHDLTPVLMLAAVDTVEARVAGLRVGADDCLARPFDFEELLARIEALARRAARFQTHNDRLTVLNIGPLSFDMLSLEVRCEGTWLDLSAKEREILKLFMSNPGRVFSRERILNAVWSVNEDPLTNVVDVYISRLRKKMGKCGKLINTVRGVGYRLSIKA